MVTLCPSARASVNNFFKRHLLLNLWLDFDQNHGNNFWSKNLAARGRGWFSPLRWRREGMLIFPIIYTENLKNLLDRNHWTDFNITWQKCFWWPTTKIFKAVDSSKNMTAMGRGLSYLYICIENFKKNLLVRNQWPDINITWQECFFGDPQQRLFKSSWFVKKHRR